MDSHAQAMLGTVRAKQDQIVVAQESRGSLPVENAISNTGSNRQRASFISYRKVSFFSSYSKFNAIELLYYDLIRNRRIRI